MELNEPTILKLYIMKKCDNIDNNLKIRDNMIIDKLDKISPIMKSQLAGSAFDIKEITPQEQSTIGETTVWEWYVIPRESGSQKLVISVDAIIEIPGNADRAKNIQIIEKTINIQPISIWDGNNVTYITQNICAVMLIGLLIVGLIRKWIKIVISNGNIFECQSC
jgi:hypothetical protein